MRQPPPNKKGLANVNLIVESLPDRGRSSWHLGAVWALSQYQENEVGKAHRQPFEHFQISAQTHLQNNQKFDTFGTFLISQDALLCFRMYFFFPSFFLVAFLQAKKPIMSHSFCSCTWECILMSTSQRNR